MTIKFTHPYRKLLTGPQTIGEQVKLLQVFESDFSNLTAEFLEYDTDAGAYRLPSAGPCIVLLFQKQTIVPNLFTTVRPVKPGKMDYYQSLIGQTMNIEIIDKA